MPLLIVPEFLEAKFPVNPNYVQFLNSSCCTGKNFILGNKKVEWML